MSEFALGFLCASVLYAIFWWRLDGKVTLDTVQTSTDNTNVTKGSIIRQYTTKAPDNKKAQMFMSPQKVREVEDEIFKGAVEYYE